jgi:hypothetical protein
MTCPVCQLDNPAETEWCDCGYNFAIDSARYCRSTTPLIVTLFYIAGVLELVGCLFLVLPLFRPQPLVWFAWAAGGAVGALFLFGAGFALDRLDQIARKLS